jgi:hypothetical protein
MTKDIIFSKHTVQLYTAYESMPILCFMATHTKRETTVQLNTVKVVGVLIIYYRRVDKKAPFDTARVFRWLVLP